MSTGPESTAPGDIAHKSVLLDEVIAGMEIKPGGHYIDATLGFGGHTQAILHAADATTVLGIERDPHVATQTTATLQHYGDRIAIVVSSYEHMSEIVSSDIRYNGIVFDLGYSSWHIDESGKGFTFQKNEPLDMRYDPRDGSESAAHIVNTWSFEQLFQIFKEYGEERLSGPAAKAIVKARETEKFQTTEDLVNVIGAVIKRGPAAGVHPATRIFQALRIAVNDELGGLQRALPQVLDVIEVGGRIAIISFHSLEDRIVKRFFNHFDTTELWVITKKPIIPSSGEIASNPRARSAKLRIAQRV